MPYKPTIPTICANASCRLEFLAARPAAGRQPTKYHNAACAQEGLSRPLTHKYWEHVVVLDGCWEWTGHRTPFGHGQISHRGKALYAHRISWTLHFGPIPDGLEVCHKCDNPWCTNPDHLFIGTHTDNLRDAQNKGRLIQPGLAGVNHPMSKLTEADIHMIRELRVAGLLQREIAQQVGVSRAMVGYILRGKNWAHIP